MTTTPNMVLVLPVVGDTSNLWGDALNTLLGLVDGHDHTTGKGVKVPSSGFNINADVNWASYAITSLKTAAFTAVAPAAMTSYVNALFTNSSDSNLWYRNSAGTNVQLTSGSTINFAIAGGIGGDYSAIGALEDFDDASDTYRFRQQVSTLVRQFAKLSSADVSLFEYKAAGATPVPSFAVTLKSPAALAAPYSVTWLAALPASQVLMQIDSAGLMTASNTLANNASLTLQGTGYIKQGTHSRQVQLVGPMALTSGGGVTVNVTKPGAQVQASTTAIFPIHRAEDVEQVQTVRIKNQAAGGAGNVTLKLQVGNDTVLIFTDVTGASATVAAGSAGYTTLTPTTPAPLAEGQTLYLTIITPAGITFDVVSSKITLTTP